MKSMVDERQDDLKNTRRNMEAALKNYAANQELFEMGAKQSSEMIYTTYRALIRSGFTETQALEIIKARGVGL